jgi:hypothetical protein
VAGGHAPLEVSEVSHVAGSIALVSVGLSGVVRR